MLSVVAILVTLLVWLASGLEARAEKRVALVIGNSAYQGLKGLKNPANDATDIAAALKQQGFEVMRGLDLTLPAMNDLMGRFAAAARDADVSLFYYAGHGFQAASKNYLVPVDAVLRSREDVAQKTVDLRAFMASLEGTKGIHIVLLDACRNNPLAGLPGAPPDSTVNGLAKIGNAAGFMIAFATKPDEVAYDGSGRNSFFTQAVLSHIGTRGDDISTMMIKVRRDVIAATGGMQVPFDESSLTRQFAFAPGAADPVSPETQLWQLGASSGDPALLRIYLERYPMGAHVTEVRSRLEQTKVASLATGSTRSAPVDAGGDDALWDLARQVRVRPLVEFYLQRHPSGLHAEAAKELLASLPAPGDAGSAAELRCERLATHPRDATANLDGVSADDLAAQVDQAIRACRDAVANHPEMPHYKALLARALWVHRDTAEAIRLYREAADKGNLRAMVSLGLIMEAGEGLPAKDVQGALALYEKAAEGGSPDGAINLAVALIQGKLVPRNVARATELLTRASEQGSAIATYNLGVLAQDGVVGSPDKALAYFKRAVELGDPRGYRAAAVLLDEGRGAAKSPTGAAEMLLRGVAADSGDSLDELIASAKKWSPDTIKAVQGRLKTAGFYNGPIDGKGGPKLKDPLTKWRVSGMLPGKGS